MDIQMKTVPDQVPRKWQELLSVLRIAPESLTSNFERKAPFTFGRGDTIFTQGSTADVAYCVVSGLVKVYFPLENGFRIILDVAGAGDFIGLLDAVGANGCRVQSLGAEAMSQASVAIFTREHVISMLKKMSSDALMELFQDVNTTWSRLLSWYIRFLALPLRDRLLRTLEYLAERYGAQGSRGVLLTLDLSHQDLAEMIASSRPMVSRLISDLLREGKIARQGRRYLLINQASPVVLLKPVVGRSTPSSLGTYGDSARLRASNVYRLARDRML